MKIKTEGHLYELENFENKDLPGQELQFIEKKQIDGVLTTICDGTTNEELLSVLINRTEYLNYKFPCRENAIAITKMQEALMWFEKRTVDRMKRGVEGKNKM